MKQRMNAALVVLVLSVISAGCGEAGEQQGGQDDVQVTLDAAERSEGDILDVLSDDMGQQSEAAEVLEEDTSSDGDTEGTTDGAGPEAEVSADALVESDSDDSEAADTQGADGAAGLNDADTDAQDDASMPQDISSQDETSDDAAEGEGTSEDTSDPPETSIEDVDVEDAALDDTAVDGTTVEDVGVEDTSDDSGSGPIDATAPDDADVVEGASCTPVGSWVLETTTAALPGEGCQPDGSPAQGPNTKTFIVTQSPDGSLIGVVPEVTEPVPEVTVTQLPDLPCSFRFTLAVSVYFPEAGGEEPSTVYLTYTYLVALSDDDVTGVGTVYTATIFDSGEVQQECTEDIAIGGSFTPSGD